ncbi:Transposon Ty3-G Gag-Pol polyprotein [Penaeus vannamei]|uniref:Transposon Ty3-G Gag-Pol polyprotein n=1 Tax=Penaeus vannamei TaxID=6689 RepID=A0A423TED0_PENVA|nr:Transposon Ty3-G Gag-Pol polyprotein [Penaeus vannamei]
MSTDAATPFTEVNAASIRLPPFSLNEALTRFRRAETQFRLKNIVKATTKADQVVAVLPKEVFHWIAPWLYSQLDDIDYDTLKQELLKEFSLSPSERVRQILNIPNTPLVDWTPKQVWQEINTLCRLPTKDEQAPTSTDINAATPYGGPSAHSLQQMAFALTTSALAAQPTIVWMAATSINAVIRSQIGFHVQDERSSKHFLIDTGAFLSIFPATQTDRRTAANDLQKLVAANRTPINTYGSRDIAMHLAGHPYLCSFFIADVTRPLLGADFLSHHNLLVDMRKCRLINTETFTPLPVNAVSIAGPPDPELHHTNPGAAAKHGVYHHIKAMRPQVHSRFRRLRPEMLHAAKLVFTEMEPMGVCSKAASPWASPLHMVQKPNNSWRLCGDYRRLNLITELDHYPMPNINDLTASIGDACIF